MGTPLENQVVVITGASAGIGAALAEELGRRGAKLVLAARRQHKLDEVAARIGKDVATVAVDVTRRQEVQRLFEAAVARFGQVDIWVNNAGRGITRSVEQLTDDDVDGMMRDNFKSALYGMQVVLPHFKARQKGVLVNVSSMLSRAPMAPQRSVYSAAKAALNSITESLRFELSAEFPGIRAVVVLPGVVATEFGNNAVGGGVDSRALPGAQDVDEVARVISDGLRDEKLDIYTRPQFFEQVLGHLHRLHGPARPAPVEG